MLNNLKKGCLSTKTVSSKGGGTLWGRERYGFTLCLLLKNSTMDSYQEDGSQKEEDIPRYIYTNGYTSIHNRISGSANKNGKRYLRIGDTNWKRSNLRPGTNRCSPFRHYCDVTPDWHRPRMLLSRGHASGPLVAVA